MAGQLQQAPAAATPARAYDRWFQTPWGRYAFALERAALQQAAGPLQGRLVVDVGCGTGRFTQALQQQGARTVGVDLDPGMLTVAAERAAGPWLVADAARLPFGDQAFDLAVAVTVLEFVADPGRVLAELARVTRPGGRVVVACLNWASPWGLFHRRRLRRPPWRRARFLTRRQLRALGGAHGRARRHGVLYAPGPFPGLARIGPLLEAAGLPLAPLGAFQILVIDRR